MAFQSLDFDYTRWRLLQKRVLCIRSIRYRWSTFLFHCFFFYFFSYVVENSLLTSLDVDQSTGNIYYTTQDSVKVFSPKDSTKRSLITGLSQPDDIKLHPQAGYVRWSCINYIPVICLFTSQIRSIIGILFIFPLMS